MPHAGKISWVGEVGRVNDRGLPGITGDHPHLAFALRVKASSQEDEPFSALVVHTREHFLKNLKTNVRISHTITQ